MVPIHLDALCLKNDRSVVETMADFSRLPHFDGRLDINPDVANLSEEILSQPFQDRSLQLKAGIHLHWALPDALTRGVQQGNAADKEGEKAIVFPPVPNRWLVTRTNFTQSKQWVVESDYVHPTGQRSQQSRVSYPCPGRSHPQPFRYLGRRLPLAAWRNQDQDANEYLETLTAVGYGEPAFAAFYPNCLSVFGFHDDAPPRSLRGVQYDVVGWFSDPQQDCLRSKVLSDALASVKYNALREVYQWVVERMQDVPLPAFPTRTICYAHLTFETDEPTDDLPEERKVAVALGNTGTEALSAYLADYSARDPTLAASVPKRADHEDQLEAINLAGQLEGRKIDVGPKFREARHSKEFTGAPAGTLWTIRGESPASAQANSHQAATLARETLPPALADPLHRLNLCQQAYDGDCHELDSLRERLFADWYKYMLCVYPPEGNRDQYPNHDEVRYFIEKNSLIPLQVQIAKNKALNFRRCQLVANLYRAVAELQLLRIEDILDWAKLRGRFQSPQSAPAGRIATLLTEATRSLLARQTDPFSDEAKAQTLRDLNVILGDAGFYESTAFSNVALSGECRSLLAQATGAALPSWPYHQRLRLNRLLLEAAFPEEIRKCAPYALKTLPAPRYWQPNEPVILIVDEVDGTVKPSPRHGQDGRLREDDGLLECHVMALEDESIDKHFEEIRSKIIGLKRDATQERMGFSMWTRQPWHPFLLEWDVEVMPLKGKYKIAKAGRHRSLSRAYDPNCVSENYQLPEDAVDLGIQPGQETLAKESNRYCGRSILTPHARLELIAQIRNFLEKRLLEEYYSSHNVQRDERTNDYFVRNIDAIIQWYKSNEGDEKDTVVDQILAVYGHLSPNVKGEAGFRLLAQSLSGFNDALLMQKQTFQLPVDEPLGFEGYQAFTRAVRDAVGSRNRVAPQPHNDFNPIRTGILRINQLRLVDTFGQVQRLSLQDNQVITTHVMTTPGNPHLAILPPRIVQPSRLNFRWLAADEGFTLEEDDDPEMNSHPVSSPICGWLLPNNLDDSLMVYDARGRALGSLNEDGRWETAPGSGPSIAGWPLPSPHLHKLVTYLQEQEKVTHGFLSEFLIVLERALENIDPENPMGHEALALLMGRPIAVVRASLNIELQGLPAIDQEWNVLRQDMERAFLSESTPDRARPERSDRETEDFTKVQFPIRIGEYRQLNDGLVGYWIEEDDTYKASRFYAPQTDGNTQEGKVTHRNIAVHRENEPIAIWQSIDDPPQKLTMLIDPRGSVHATSGILPTKAIAIPVDQFSEALRNIEVTFLSAPILTDRGKITLPLPDEPGYVWSWLEKENGVWDSARQIAPVGTGGTGSAPQELREGWLKLTQKDRK